MKSAYVDRDGIGGIGERVAEPWGRAGRRDAVSSVAPIVELSTLPASVPRDDHRTPTTSTLPPSPPNENKSRRPCGSSRQRAREAPPARAPRRRRRSAGARDTPRRDSRTRPPHHRPRRAAAHPVVVDAPALRLVP